MKYALATIITLLTTILVEYSYGRTLICKCGYIKLWFNGTSSLGDSQHITDWYSFSHIIHGFAFFYLARLFKKFSLFQSFLLALTLETIWELIENNSILINRYRETTVASDYNGDSILNSCFDILAMSLGFYLARKLPVWAIIVLTIIMELAAGYFIRDNLTLNILMLLFPFESIKNWQIGR
jgi:hypothetical protein